MQYGNLHLGNFILFSLHYQVQITQVTGQVQNFGIRIHSSVVVNMMFTNLKYHPLFVVHVWKHLAMVS